MNDPTPTPDERRAVLVVDDDTALCEMLVRYLEPEGFRVETAHDGNEGLIRARSGEFRLVILDVMLPGIDGFEVLRNLRRASTVPVLMLTARGDDVDRIVGLEVGADDYLAKPFNPRELLARMRAILRRATGPAAIPRGLTVRLAAGELALDPPSLSASLAGSPLRLTAAEFRVLSCLAEHAGDIVPRDRLTEQALGRRYTPFDRAIDTHVSNLRRKLGATSSGGSPIVSVRNAGYLLAVDEQG